MKSEPFFRDIVLYLSFSFIRTSLLHKVAAFYFSWYPERGSLLVRCSSMAFSMALNKSIIFHDIYQWYSFLKLWIGTVSGKILRFLFLFLGFLSAILFDFSLKQSPAQLLMFYTVQVELPHELPPRSSIAIQNTTSMQQVLQLVVNNLILNSYQ